MDLQIFFKNYFFTAIYNDNLTIKEDELLLALENGFDINCRDKYNFTFLMRMRTCCLIEKYEEIFNLLIKYGVDINLQDDNGDTALIQACYSDSSIIELLLNRGADKTIKNKKGLTAFDVAKKHGVEKYEKLLEEHVPNYTKEEIKEILKYIPPATKILIKNLSSYTKEEIKEILKDI